MVRGTTVLQSISSPNERNPGMCQGYAYLPLPLFPPDINIDCRCRPPCRSFLFHTLAVGELDLEEIHNDCVSDRNFMVQWSYILDGYNLHERSFKSRSATDICSAPLNGGTASQICC